MSPLIRMKSSVILPKAHSPIASSIHLGMMRCLAIAVIVRAIQMAVAISRIGCRSWLVSLTKSARNDCDAWRLGFALTAAFRLSESSIQ